MHFKFVLLVKLAECLFWNLKVLADLIDVSTESLDTLMSTHAQCSSDWGIRTRLLMKEVYGCFVVMIAVRVAVEAWEGANSRASSGIPTNHEISYLRSGSHKFGSV